MSRAGTAVGPLYGDLEKTSSRGPRKGTPAKEVLGYNGRAYCENTSIHGFAYWVNAPRSI